MIAHQTKAPRKIDDRTRDVAHAQTISAGPLYGVGIHYRCVLAAGDDSKTVESVALLQLGTRKNSSYVRGPDGLIVREEVFHTAASLAATGIAP